jgi:uncharacterized protein YndB with AHSA1/START domain
VTKPDDTPESVREAVDIAAPPEEVFDALTDPAQVAEWWVGDDAAPPPLGGELRVVDAPRTLELTWGGDTVRYDLAPAVVRGAPGTRLTVTHTRANDVLALAA